MHCALAQLSPRLFKTEQGKQSPTGAEFPHDAHPSLHSHVVPWLGTGIHLHPSWWQTEVNEICIYTALSIHQYFSALIKKADPTTVEIKNLWGEVLSPLTVPSCSQSPSLRLSHCPRQAHLPPAAGNIFKVQPLKWSPKTFPELGSSPVTIKSSGRNTMSFLYSRK